MRHRTRVARLSRIALLAWLVVVSFVTASLRAQETEPLPRPTPIPRPPIGGSLELSGDPDIVPQAEQTFAGGQPATFERQVFAKRGDTRIATCVTVRLDPPPGSVDFTLSGTIAPKQQASNCATGQVRTCGRDETGDCSKYTVTIDSRPATPPQAYRFALIGRCEICVPVERNVGEVQLTIAKPGVEVKALSSTPSPPNVQAGGAVTYSLEVQRTSYLGPITIVPTVENDPQGLISFGTPITIPPANNPNRKHAVTVTATTQATSASGTYRIRIAPSLPMAILQANLVPANVTLDVNARPTLTVSVSNLTEAVRRATCAQFDVTVQHANFPAQFQAPVTFQVVSVPPSPALPGNFTRVVAPPVSIVNSTGLVTTKLLIGVPMMTTQARYDFDLLASVQMGNQTVTGSARSALGVDDKPPLVKVSPVPPDDTVDRGMSRDFMLVLTRSPLLNCSPGFTGDVQLVTTSFTNVTGTITQPGTMNVGNLKVTVNSMAAGDSYPFTIKKANAEGDYEVELATVTVTVPPPPQPPPPPGGANLTVSPASLAFSAVAGGANPAAKALSIGSTGAQLNWTASDTAPWLTVTPASGLTGTNASAAVNVAGLAAGTYNATITISSAGLPSVTVPVTLMLTAPPPPSAGLVVSPASLSFTAPQGGPAPAPQVLSIASSGAALTFTVTDNAAFVNETPASGTTPGATNVSVNVGGLVAGSYNAIITVSAPGVASRTVPVNLTVTAVGPGTPVVNGFSPVSGGPGTQVEVIGANFVGVSQVQFNTTTASFQPSDAGRLFATVPPGATTGPIRVTNTSGTGSSFTPFTVTSGGAPSIAGFSPLSGAPGDRITIQGANFRDPSQVFFNGRQSPFVLFGGPNFLSAEVPTGATSGPIRVDTSGGSATSAQSFTVSGSPPPPPSAGLVVSPASLNLSAPQGGPAPQAQVLSIGSSGAPLNWSVSDNATFVNETPASGTTPGATNVSVNVGGLALGAYSATITVSAAGASPVVVPVSLTVTAVGGGTPVVNGFNPVSGSPNVTQVEVIGANFTGVTQVTFDNTPASFQPSDAGRLFATVPPGATTGPIRVTNASGTGASFTPFTVTSGSGPSIAGFSPGSGRPGDRITIQGANFTDPSQVFFNGTPSPFVLFAGSNFLSAEVPSGATTGPIRVTTGAGSATSAQSFVVTQ